MKCLSPTYRILSISLIAVLGIFLGGPDRDISPWAQREREREREVTRENEGEREGATDLPPLKMVLMSRASPLRPKYQSC